MDVDGRNDFRSSGIYHHINSLYAQILARLGKIELLELNELLEVLFWILPRAFVVLEIIEISLLH